MQVDEALKKLKADMFYSIENGQELTAIKGTENEKVTKPVIWYKKADIRVAIISGVVATINGIWQNE